jgi:NTE family protein
VFSIGAIVLSFFRTVPQWLIIIAIMFSALGLLLWLTAGWLAFYLKSKASAFVKAGFGINKGEAFHQWMTDILQRNQVPTCEALEKKMREKIAPVRLRSDRFDLQRMGYNSAIEGSLVKIISCDITNENKVEFPDFAWFYYDHPGQANPADFVRASMSIPVFYRPFMLPTLTPASRIQRMRELGYRVGPRGHEKLAAVLKNIDTDGMASRFVDGGILSNFPINVFHNAKVAIARMPTLGAKLEDEAHKTPEKKRAAKNSLGSYLGSIFSTLRFYYDRDFLKKNSVYQLGLAHIDVAGINWLDFSMTRQQQADLFRRGVAAATTFFLGGKFYRDGVPFDWPGYSWERYKMERKRKMID